MLFRSVSQSRYGVAVLGFNQENHADVAAIKNLEVLAWDDHLATAVTPVHGRSAEETVRADREGRW